MVAAKGHPLEALFFLALTTSMRKGEVLGLMWTNVDWEKSTLRIERQLQPVSFEGSALVPTKTKAGRRTIMIGKVAIALLKEHREKQELQKVLAGDRWKDHGMIFTTSIGAYIDQTNVSRAFKQILQDADLPDRRFHGYPFQRSIKFDASHRAGLTIQAFAEPLPTIAWVTLSFDWTGP